jgi:hypothetical protein
VRRLVIAILSAALILPWAAPAFGNEPRCPVSRDTGKCLITATDPGVPERPGVSFDDSAEPASDRKPATGPGSPCIWKAEAWYSAGDSSPVPCTSEHGVWSNEWNCYVSPSPVDPQPPTTAPEWDGHSPGDGAIYGCYNVAGGLRGTMWLAEPPDAADAGPTPGEVAQIAVERMNLRAIEIGMSPDPNGPGVVALPTWLWVQDPGEQTFGPITRTASAGSVTVTATARVERIVWAMGDGTQVVCTGPGTPYEPRFGRSASPDCGHTYTRESGYQPGQEYTVTATSEWVVDWEGAGQSGSLDVEDLSSSVQVSVGEAQVLVN